MTNPWAAIGLVIVALFALGMWGPTRQLALAITVLLMLLLILKKWNH